MALTPEEEAELAELMKTHPEFAAAAAPKKGAVIDQKPTPGSEEGLGGIQAVYGKDWTAYGQGGQPIQQTPDDRARDDAAITGEAERIAGMLDPRFSLVPQILALQPATNDPGGDQAAAAKYQAGQRDAIFIYEPPVDVVRRHLLDNPGLLRAISPDEVPSVGDIEGLTNDSPLYKSAADYMYKKADEAATEKGLKVIRYSQAPWLQSDKSIPETLSLKVKGADPELANRAQAFVLGVDDMGAAGIMRANQELTEPTSMLTQPRMGLNESVPQSSADVNAWTEQEYPLSYGAGQVVGMLSPRSIFNKLWGGLEQGGAWLAQAAAKTRLGALAADAVAPAIKSAAGAVGDAAVGGVAAASGQVLQEGVDAAGRGELPSLAEAGERVRDVGETGGVLAALGSGGRRLAGAGADSVRDSSRYADRYGRGLVRRTEPNLDWRARTAITGPKLNAETKALVKESGQGGYLPSDVLAEEIAGPVGRAAQQNTQVARGRARAEQANAQRTPEGAAPLPMTHLQEASLERLRDHHQPQPGGGLRPVDDKFRGHAKVFNGLIEDVSTSPIEGAVKLDPDEAGSFLGARSRYKLLKDDIEAANARAGAAPVETIERDAYLRTIKDSRARAAADEEIEASIEDIVGDVTPTPARRAAVEQQVLRELVDEASFVEAHGSLGEYLKQRGIDAVYVKPSAYDARRADTLTKGLSDEGLAEAAKLDRQRRSLGGAKGGYDRLVKKGEEDIAKAEAVEKSVAPGGNAFQPIAGLYQSNPGEKQLVDQVKALADQSGVSEQLERMRGLQDTLAVTNRARARGPDGRPRSGGLFNPTNWRDVAPLRAFPVLKALEGPLGPLRGSTAGRPALMGGGETEAAQRRAESGARGRYEAARDRRLKEIADDKARDAEDDKRKQSEPIRRRR